MTLAFIACVESGNLENQALLLFRSIRKFAGHYKDAPIYSFQPRRGAPLRKDTLNLFEALEVTHSTEVLNAEFHHYPIGNKVFASARAEELLKEDILVFLDSDSVIVNEPRDLDLPAGTATAVRPVDHKNRGSTGPSDPNDGYWRRLYAICGAPEAPFLETGVSAQKIRSYWNAGLLAVNRSEGLFQRWKDDFLKLMQAGHVPKGQITFMDQLALAATLARVAERIRVLDPRYNYPLPKRPLLKEPYRTAELDSLIHIHYHRWFNKPGFLSLVSPPLNNRSPVYNWLSSWLPFQPTIDDPLRF